jgi:hypothetical protein
MTRALTTVAVLAIASLVAVPAEAGKRHQHKHKPTGVKGVVLNSTCPGACAEPPPPAPLYTGPVTVSVNRTTDGTAVASQATTDGHFRMRVKRGTYDVSAIPPNPTCEPQPQQVCPPPCEPTPTTVCPLPAQGAAIIAPCLSGETQRIQVRRHRFTRVELHVRNVCIV